MATLTLGSFQLLAPDGSTRVLADGTSWGAPVPIEVAVRSWLQDGAIVVTQGHDNRDVNMRVRFYGNDLTALAQIEARLVAELEKPNTLTWNPGNGQPASVFTVVTSSLATADEQFEGEVQDDPWRTYVVRLVCLAFVRSAVETVTTALPATGTTTTLVNNGSATTNWTGTVNAVVTAPGVTSGAVGVTSGVLTGVVVDTLTYTAAIATSSTPYLDVDWRGVTGISNLAAFGDGVALTKLSETVSPTAGYTRTKFAVAASSVAVLRLETTTYISPATMPGGFAVPFFVDNVNRTDVKPQFGSTRQLQRMLAVAGSARTQGSLAIEHASSSLGQVLAYFWPPSTNGLFSAYSPPLRQYRVSGGAVTTDATMVSGAREPIGSTTVTYDIPAASLPPGTYLLMVRTGVNSAGTISYTAVVRHGSTQTGSGLAGTGVMPATGLGYGIAAIARLMLPPIGLPDTSSATVRLTLVASVSANLDEAWLFNTSIGQLTSVDCGDLTAASGGPAKRLFMEPASVDRPRPTIFIGDAADRSDAYYPTVINAWQPPVLYPPQTNVFTVTTNALDASVSLRHFPHWHSHAAS